MRTNFVPTKRHREEKEHLIGQADGEGLKFLEICKAYGKAYIYDLISFHNNSSDLYMLLGFFLCSHIPSNDIPRQYFFTRDRHLCALYAHLSVPMCITIRPGNKLPFFIFKTLASVSFRVADTQN